MHINKLISWIRPSSHIYAICLVLNSQFDGLESASPDVLRMRGGMCSTLDFKRKNIVSISDVVMVRNGEDDSFSKKIFDILEGKVGFRNS